MPNTASKRIPHALTMLGLASLLILPAMAEPHRERRQPSPRLEGSGSSGSQAYSVPTLPFAIRPELALVLFVSLLRTFIAFHVPLTEDEAYYWTWSRHLAFGYTDHPPMVAWLIALSSPLGHTPGIIRLPFIFCQALAALALGRTAFLLSGNFLAASISAMSFTLIPQVRLAIGEALPDGPYLLCWSLALMLTAQACRRSSPLTFALLGASLGGAMLSRFFGWALLAGVIAFSLTPARRVLWKQGFWIAPLTALLLYAPFVAWNAAHGWENLAFTVRDRQSFQAFSAEHLSVLSTTRFLVYALLLWIVAFFVAVRPRNALIAWTALPFPTFLALLSFFESVESYWLLGPCASLCVGIGIASSQGSERTRKILGTLAIPAAYTLASALFLSLPEPTQAALLRPHASPARGWYSGTYAYLALAHDTQALLAGRSAIALTDRYEIAAELAYHHVSSVIIGRSPQEEQWARWYAPAHAPERALLVSMEAPAAHEPLRASLVSACASLQPGPVLRYAYAGQPAATFFTTWCSSKRPLPAGIASLWKRE